MTARWELRFESFLRALAVLQRAAHEYRTRALSELERAGLIQHYEMAWELAWKTMRDFLVDEGQELPVVTPGSVIRAAFSAGLIADGEGWMGALKLRNQLSHEYDEKRAALAIAEIVERYLALFETLTEKLKDATGSGNRS